jgi:hypothetical protein
VVSYFLRYFSSTSTEQISPDSAGRFTSFDPVGFAIFATLRERGEPPGCQEGSGERYNGEQQTKKSDPLGPIKAVYDYTDESGDLLFQALRFEPLNSPKVFRQRTNPARKNGRSRAFASSHSVYRNC